MKECWFENGRSNDLRRLLCKAINNDLSKVEEYVTCPIKVTTHNRKKFPVDKRIFLDYNKKCKRNKCSVDERRNL